MICFKDKFYSKVFIRYNYIENINQIKEELEQIAQMNHGGFNSKIHNKIKVFI